MEQPDEAEYIEETQPDTTQPQSQPAVSPETNDELWGSLHPCSSHSLQRVDFFKEKPTVNIGRNASSDVILPGFKISNYHATVIWNKHELADFSEVIIYDRSSNGTFLNGKKIGKGERAILKDGNEVAFGVATEVRDDNGLYDYRYVYRDYASGSAKRAVYASYDLSHQLGKGSFATVYRALHRQTGQWVAVKAIHETKRQGTAAANANNMISREINVMQALRHPNICELREVFWNSNGSIDLVLELVEGGDLLDFILRHEGLTEPMAKHITYQLCKALSYIHAKGIAHRDLKPENVLLTKDNPPIVKVADFGLAKIVDSMTRLHTMCGTPSYLAPEVVTQQDQSGYDSLVDSWSVGVIVFSMLTNTTPFIENSEDDLRRKVATRQIEWTQLDEHKWRDRENREHLLSPEVLDFVRRLLEFVPQTRINMSDALSHPWFQNWIFYWANSLDYPKDDDGSDGSFVSLGGLTRDVSMQSITTTFSETDSVSQGLQDLRLYAQPPARSGTSAELVGHPNGNGSVVQAGPGGDRTPPQAETPLPPLLHKNGLNRRSDVLHHAQVTGSQLPEPSWEMVKFAQSQEQQSEPTSTPKLTATGEQVGGKTPNGSGKGPNKRMRSELTPLPEENGHARAVESSPLSSPGDDMDEDQRPPKKRGRATPAGKAKRGSGAKASAAGTGSTRKTRANASTGNGETETPVALRRSSRSTAAKGNGRR
ncbi:Pkinase-domain-containing protein [Mycena chlorophos]|uniref:Pkinase-domain-containing protein n=1 Tax=Mycena chlorophos TaxID=658473 RepID=A0A8H6WAY0_MYCCL|nr:Pkinase-domain-containing protein [Mycena chlorophos]